MKTPSIYRFIITMITTCVLLGFTQARATESQVINAGWLLETARTVILTNSPWAESDCLVEVTGAPYDITVYRNGTIEVVGLLERIPNSIKDIGAVSVEVYADGELYLRFDPSPYLAVSITTFLAAHDLERGDILSADDVNETMVNVRLLPTDDLFTNIDDIIGLSARMNIHSGRILTDGLLELPTLVFRGEDVLVYIPLGTTLVTLHGTSLDSGALGDEIRVRNPDSDAIINAIVTGVSQAEIKLL